MYCKDWCRENWENAIRQATAPVTHERERGNSVPSEMEIKQWEQKAWRCVGVFGELIECEMLGIGKSKRWLRFGIWVVITEEHIPLERNCVHMASLME